MKRIAAIVVGALILVSCGGDDDYGYHVKYVEAERPDGSKVPCILYTRGSISCDWSPR